MKSKIRGLFSKRAKDDSELRPSSTGGKPKPQLSGKPFDIGNKRSKSLILNLFTPGRGPSTAAKDPTLDKPFKDLPHPHARNTATSEVPKSPTNSIASSADTMAETPNQVAGPRVEYLGTNSPFPEALPNLRPPTTARRAVSVPMPIFQSEPVAKNPSVVEELEKLKRGSSVSELRAKFATGAKAETQEGFLQRRLALEERRRRDLINPVVLR
jgi:hypothetical protein